MAKNNTENRKQSAEKTSADLLCIGYTDKEMEKICKLQEMVKSCSDLEIGTEKILLAKFLNFKCWDVDKAYKAIHDYFDYKNNYYPWIAKQPIRDLLKIVDTNTRFVLKNVDKSGKKVIIYRLTDVSHIPNYFQDLVELDEMYVEGLLLEQESQKNGFTVVLDFRCISLKYLKHLTPSNVSAMNKRAEVFPVRNYSCILITQGILMKTTLSLVMPFLSKEIKERFEWIGNDLQKLQKYINYEDLPSEYGGPKGNPQSTDYLKSILLDNEEYLTRLQKYVKRTT